MIRPHRLVASLLAAALLAGCGVSPQQQFERATAAFAAQDFNAARIDLVSALREEPDDKAMLLLLARTQLRLGDSAGAMATAGKLRARGAKGADLILIEAEAALLAGKPQEAIVALTDDFTPDGWRIRAAAMLDSGDPSGALGAFARGMANGGDLRLASDYAHFLLSANDVAGASALVQHMRSTAPNAFETLMLLGDLNLRGGRTAAALVSYRKAAELYPRQLLPRLAEAETLESMGKLKAAEQAVERAAALAPDDWRVKSLRLRLAAMAGEWAKVRAQLLPVENGLNPQSPEAMLYGEALLRLGYAEQARVLLSRTVLLQPGNRYARRMLGEAQLTAGDAGGAYRTLIPLGQGLLVQRDEMALLEKAARSAGEPDADDWRARLASDQFKSLNELVRKGEEAMMRNDWPVAVAAWRGVLAIGEDTMVLANLAFSMVMAGDAAGAIAPADRALALAPDDAEIRLMAGRARVRAGRDLETAQELLRRVQQDQPMNLEAALLLKNAQTAAG